MKPKHSKPDSRGMMFIACSECDRGGNGDQSCSSGWLIKRGGQEKGACFSGSLLDKFKEADAAVK
jgi:hypothetical protein